MSTTPDYAPGSDVGTARNDSRGEGGGFGWFVFAGVSLVIAGALNVIYGIAAISDSKFFVHNTHYVFSSLNTWGWVTLVFGVLQMCAAFSLWQAGTFGRVFGITAAGLNSITALLSLPAYPFLSLAIFAIDMMIIYGLTTYDRRGATR
jgi:uncharacterized membrane protein (DUF2068 family)